MYHSMVGNSASLPALHRGEAVERDAAITSFSSGSRWMVGAELAAVLGQAGELRQPVEGQVHLEGRAVALVAVEPRVVRRRAGVARRRGRACGTDRRSTRPPSRCSSRAVGEDDAASRVSPSSDDALDAALGLDARAGARAPSRRGAR